LKERTCQTGLIPANVLRSILKARTSWTVRRSVKMLLSKIDKSFGFPFDLVCQEAVLTQGPGEFTRSCALGKEQKI
jgi:hypothetical protein